jgi:anti-anti-sigma factor
MEQRAASVVVTTTRAGAPHLTAAGELDTAGAFRLRAQLDDALAGRDGAGPSVSLDLSRVTHVSAEALAVLVSAYRRLRESGGSLVLTDVSPVVVRVLRISGLHRVLAVETKHDPRRSSARPPASERDEAQR